jgi:hypothetical protein
MLHETEAASVVASETQKKSAERSLFLSIAPQDQSRGSARQSSTTSVQGRFIFTAVYVTPHVTAD